MVKTREGLSQENRFLNKFTELYCLIYSAFKNKIKNFDPFWEIQRLI